MVPWHDRYERLREVEHRLSVTVAMVYDQMPVADHFRRISDSIVIGAMQTRGSDEVGYFYLARLDDEPGPSQLSAGAAGNAASAASRSD